MEWSTSDTISVVSALAALASAAYAYKTYRATVDLKKHDFSLQLQTANETLRGAVKDLPDLVAQANSSRRAILTVQGLSGGSVWNQWAAGVAEAEAEIRALQNRLPGEERFGEISLSDLRELIVITHGLQARATKVAVAMREAMQQDDQRRQQLTEDRRAERANRAAQGGFMADVKRG